MGTPEVRPTAQPPEEYYMYILPPYGNETFTDDKKEDEVFFNFKQNEEFKNNLKLYAASLLMKELAEEKNKDTYQHKANFYKKRLTHYLSDNKNTCFDVTYKGIKKQLIEVLKGQYNKDFAFKETIDTAASISLEDYFTLKYPDMPVFKTRITINNLADTIRAGIDHFAGRKNKQSIALLESFNLLDGDKIKVSQSKYTNFFINKLSILPPQGVINFNDIYDETFSDKLDKQFSISYALLPIVLIALVHSGDAVIALRNGVTLTASNLDILPKTGALELYEFKYISKPKDMAIEELIKLFEILDIPKGLINNPSQREKGLEELIIKTSDLATKAAQASSLLNGEFTLWDEPLIGLPIAKNFKESILHICNEFGNFGSRYNTVARLNNFNLTMEDVKRLAKDIEAIEIVGEYDRFKYACSDNVNYIKNLEYMDLGLAFKAKIEIAKENFRRSRDAIDDNKNGDIAGNDINSQFTILKQEYIDIYFVEHKKKRLGINDAKRKGEIISSPKLSNIKRLRAISILSTAKLSDIETTLANLKVCYDLTPVMLKTSHICPKCGFMLGEVGISVTGQLDNIENRMDDLFNEWTKTLLNTITDPLVFEQRDYLKPEQKKAMDDFLVEKELPETIDNFFIGSINALLVGFEPVVIQTDEFMHKIDAIGPCDVDTFKIKLMDIIAAYTKGKDKDKLRIVVKR